MYVVDDKGVRYNFVLNNGILTVKRKDIKEVEYIKVVFDEFNAVSGEDGYYVVADANKTGSQLCRFTEKADYQMLLKQNLMPIFGVKKENLCKLLIVQGMKNEFHIQIGVKDSIYHASVVFLLNGDEPYEDISLKIVELDINSQYSDMAGYYRNYVLTEKGCTLIKERVKENLDLRYAMESVEIRIRLGWKPAPPQVLEQTEENEPEMFVACTFERVKDIIDELKRQGVEKAELCLIGWNKSGHDGRYPQMFPVEEKLGGEKGLKELIVYAQKNGYKIVCHTNSTDCYSIADCYSDDIVAKEKDGSLSVAEYAWSGGRMYNLCPHKAIEFAKRDLPKVAELGFRGIHYIDVMNVVPLRKCYDEKHPATTRDTERLYQEIAVFAKKLFGGFASEGAFDFSAPYLDYALYVTFDENKDELFDEEIPLWQLVYHGIVLSNPSTATVNYPVKSEKSHLKLIEYGGRPTFYFYSKFMSGGTIDDWLGREDLICDTDEQLQYAVSKIKEAYDEYTADMHLQTEFIEKHYMKEKDVYITEYNDGSSVETDYNSGKIKRNYK